MSADAATQAQHVVDIASAEHHADVVSAYWHRLKGHGIPPRLRDEWTYAKFFAPQVTVEWDDSD